MTVAAARQQERTIEQTTIHVVAIAPAKPGQKMAAVKDAEQGWFKIWPDKLHLINKGDSYNISFTINDEGTVRFIDGTPKHVTPYGHQPSESKEDAAASKVRQAVKQTQAANVQNHAPLKPVGKTDPTPERIFTCGGLNNAISSHQVSVTDVEAMITAVNNLRMVWASTFGADE